MKSFQPEEREDRGKSATPGEWVGSLLRMFVGAVLTVAKTAGKILTLFGLWFSLGYAAFGLFLHFVYDFNPFDKSDNAKIYLAGFALTLAIAIIFTCRNFIVRPVKSVVKGYRSPVWKRQDAPAEDKKESAYSASRRSEYEEISRREPRRKKKEASAPAREPRVAKNVKTKELAVQKTPEYEISEYREPYFGYREQSYPLNRNPFSDQYEKPKVYFSTKEPNTLIHEYRDRFEVFKMIDGKPVRDKVEFKDDVG